MKKLSLCAFAMLMTVGLSATTAQAWFGPWGGGYLGANYNSALGYQQPPFYSMYPPVYYSEPRAYPYGRTPIPQPPVPTPAREVVRVYRSANSAVAAKPAPQPITIQNPFYQPKLAQSK